MNVLYVLWEGPGTRYLDVLFLPIFARLHAVGVHVTVLQFRWGDPAEEAVTRTAAMAHGIPLVIRRVPQGFGGSVSTVLGVVRGAFEVVRLVHRLGIDVVMPRAVVPAAMVLAARPLLGRAAFVYEADGLVADERADFGGWSRTGWSYRLFNGITLAAVRAALRVVVRARRAVPLLLERAGLPETEARKFVVTTNGRDPEIFTPGTDEARAVTRHELCMMKNAPLVIYVGSLGAKYDLDGMMTFFEAVRRRRPDARLLVLTAFGDAARAAAAWAGVPDDALDVRLVPSAEVPALVAAADLGLAFIVRAISTQAVSATKLGEYLLCGTPVLATLGVGDHDEHLGTSEAGRTLDPALPESIEAAADWFVNDVLRSRDRLRPLARALGEAHFALPAAVAAYLDALTGPPVAPASASYDR